MAFIVYNQTPNQSSVFWTIFFCNGWSSLIWKKNHWLKWILYKYLVPYYLQMEFDRKFQVDPRYLYISSEWEVFVWLLIYSSVLPRLIACLHEGKLSCNLLSEQVLGFGYFNVLGWFVVLLFSLVWKAMLVSAFSCIICF